MAGATEKAAWFANISSSLRFGNVWFQVQILIRQSIRPRRGRAFRYLCIVSAISLNSVSVKAQPETNRMQSDRAFNQEDSHVEGSERQ